ncbi:hypothetical protein Tco_0695006 [Tanacetum coccineum]
MSMTIQSSVKDKILATSSETSKVENAPTEMLRDLDQQMEKRADDATYIEKDLAFNVAIVRICLRGEAVKSKTFGLAVTA